MSKRSATQAIAQLRRGDSAYLSAVRGAHVVEAAPAAMYAVYLLLALLVVAVVWASLAQVDIVARAQARVVPDGREQVIASLEGGILRELYVKEGQQVREGQPLAQIDPTRFEAQQAEGQSRRLALRGAVARLEAEASGRPLRFPQEVLEATEVVAGETDAYQARQQALQEALEINQRNAALLQRELRVAETMSAKGLMSEVEVMRLRRQVNDLQMATRERVNRFRQDASTDLVKVRNELALLEQQMVVRDDVLRRTELVSPVRGVVRAIRANTLGGVISPGATVMEILPVGSRVLVEARIHPRDIGFVKVGQDVVIKLTAYEYTVYGGLKGTVQSISPDALTDERGAAASGEGTYYRALVRADRNSLNPGRDAKRLDVLPGMTGMADIRTGERSVLSFVLRPMLKSQEAFRER
ncbi:MAG: HlyD family type I secretion periplasmic adaptor subunit [Rubrivivax sp.]|jgi:adhesin transport system membrane fusion protein